MRYMTIAEIRESFLSYFESKGHLRMASSSLIPVGDPTLLLTNAGMVQFKPYFVGQAEPPRKRLTTSQKAFRTVDIEEVGDATHLTMFEMLGNFSIGDYFKKEAIDFAVEFVTTVFEIPAERFHATIHDSDDEAGDLWRAKGFTPERIHKFGDDDNWWGPAGLEGPCGPCSELHYDFGVGNGCGHSDCGPNCENPMNVQGDTCNRFVELWNLVFMQYYHHLDGTRTPLPAPSVDTGMGLERAGVILQKVDTIYKTDLFAPLISKIEELSGKTYGEVIKTDYAMHAVADHSRSASFLIADGVVPGNEGRGYVLRRVVRRAIRQARSLGMTESFLGDISRVVIDSMGDVYPELKTNESFIFTVLRLEEERFQQAFQNGYSILIDALESTDVLAGEVMFQLWDTYGFPVEMTQEIARESGVEVDTEGFDREMKAQRERGRAAGNQFGGDLSKIRVYESLGVGETSFVGYDNLTYPSVVVGLISSNELVNQVSDGHEVEIVLIQTPFYPEGGGQIGDVGEIVGPDGKIEVTDTQTVMPGLIVHFGKVALGSVSMGDAVDSYVDPIHREDTARNHTATHMLHAALRQVLGTHVRQAGSYVAPDRLRFDFTHVQQLTDDEMWQVQFLVNEKIRYNARILKSEDTYTEAIRQGALAFFGDKYGETVRLIEIANGETFSFEVCGGTHVQQTGEVGSVFILNESSIGAGMRRLEAVSGRAAEKLVWDRFHQEEKLARSLGTSLGEIEPRVENLLEELDSLRKEKETAERKLALQSAEGLLDARREVGGISLVSARTAVANVDSLREISDWLRDKLGSGIVVLGTVIDDRPTITVTITSDLVKQGLDARDFAKELGKTIGGGGGGRPEMAQAGGRIPEKLDEAINAASEIVASKAAS